MNEEYITLELTPEDEEYIDLLLDESEIEIELSMEEEGVSEYPVYKGAYEVTPSLETQTLETAYRVLTSNVVIKPIPSSGGDISFNNGVISIR